MKLQSTATSHLKPSCVLITGASSGIGAALAAGYASPGITLYILGRDKARLESVATECRTRGAQVECASVDVTDKAAMAEVIARMDDLTPIDVVIANAGISTSFLPPPERGRKGGGQDNEHITHERKIEYHVTPTQPSPLQVEGSALAEQVFAVNFAGVIHTIHPLIERMKARGRGHIAIMSSLAGICALPSAPAYSASKAAVRVYGDALRGMLKSHNVHVSVICPGWISTPLTDKNQFPMPLIMPVERAIHIIMRNLEKKKARIAFPFSLYAALHVLAFLPVTARDFVLHKISAKAHKS